jgi:hypothetical protein
MVSYGYVMCTSLTLLQSINLQRNDGRDDLFEVVPFLNGDLPTEQPVRSFYFSLF